MNFPKSPQIYLEKFYDGRCSFNGEPHGLTTARGLYDPLFHAVQLDAAVEHFAHYTVLSYQDAAFVSSEVLPAWMRMPSNFVTSRGDAFTALGHGSGQRRYRYRCYSTWGSDGLLSECHLRLVPIIPYGGKGLSGRHVSPFGIM